MAGENDVCFVTEDGQTIQSIIIPKSCSIEQFFDILVETKHLDSPSRIRLFDYNGDLIYPSLLKLPINSLDTVYFLQILPETASDSCYTCSDDVKMDLVALESRISEIEEMIHNESPVNRDYLQNLKRDFEKFRSKLENGNFVKRINASNEISPAHRKLKYRRLSDARQKEVREKFLKLCNESLSTEVLKCLRLPSFDCTECSDEEILRLLYFMYTDFDLINTFRINTGKLQCFLFQVYKNYNEVPFHNFRHSFCVTQMMYAMILKIDLLKHFTVLDILVLITSCICHDLDHPGYNNIYQVNARTELAIRYNDISPLENHHCSMAFRILDLPECNIFENLAPADYRYTRESIIRCILATDMARHNEILMNFREALDEGFDFSKKAHKNLLLMVLIKVADISNEARPMNVAEPWLDKLFKEFFSQSDKEKEEGLPVTPFMDREKITKPSSQCSFIGIVLLPLFEALVDLFPVLVPMILQPVQDALDYYRKLNEAVKDEQRQQRKSVVTLDATTASSTVTSPSSPCIASSIQAQLEQRANIIQQVWVLPRYNTTWKSEDVSIFSEEGTQSMDEFTDEEEETVTEVAVSEKTLKFKISTESSGVRSHPGSRKGSREKTQDMDFSRVCRYERSNRTSDSGADKRSWSSSENTSSYEDRRSTNAIPEGSSELHNALNDKLRKFNKETDQKPQTSSTRSPDLKRLMNRVVRDFRGTKNKVANGVKNADDSSSKGENKTPPNPNRPQHKEPKSPSWMATLLQNIKLRGASHDPDSTQNS
ncbi:high affinity cGMP-specific 3',5'-cyclic phosphodiesterase 9A [Planococcus citri]|uniref:high affinity cGMP-specific 3',5'-cyclic phosphodiesterase 9A n=1 Tax=Planococcus citri TaxID=170843 RepID=UPI0031F94F77